MLNLFKALFPVSSLPKQMFKSGKSSNARPLLDIQERESVGKTGSGVRFFVSFLSTQERKTTSVYKWEKATI